MKQCMIVGGDTDTNAAISGGVIGAYCGIENIMGFRLKRVLECQPLDRPNNPSWRPRFIQPAYGCISEMLRLIEIAPEQVEFVEQYQYKELDFPERVKP